MDLKQNINKIHYDLLTNFKSVKVSEKSNLKIGNYIEFSILEKNKEVRIILKKKEIENKNFIWEYYSNPITTDHLVERQSSINTFIDDVKDIFKNNRFSSTYIVEDISDN